MGYTMAHIYRFMCDLLSIEFIQLPEIHLLVLL